MAALDKPEACTDCKCGECRKCCTSEGKGGKGMTKEEMDYIGAMNMCDEISNEAYKKIMCHCDEQEPCEDAISRQAVLDIVEREQNKGDALSEIEKLPPVNPQRTGHWIKDDITERSKSAYKHKCDRCGAYHRAMYDYCPSCGAKMFEPQERSGEE